MDLGLWDCLGMDKTCIIAKYHSTDLVICSHSRERKTLSYGRINTVFRKNLVFMKFLLQRMSHGSRCSVWFAVTRIEGS